MRLVILYRPHSEHEGLVLDYIRDYKMRHPGTEPELISLDTIEGAATAQLYAVTSYPAILAVSRDGSLLQLWQGPQLPLMRELEVYALSF